MKQILFVFSLILSLGLISAQECTSDSTCTSIYGSDYHCCTSYSSYYGQCVSEFSYYSYCSSATYYYGGCSYDYDCAVGYSCCPSSDSNYGGYCIEDYSYSSYCYNNSSYIIEYVMIIVSVGIIMIIGCIVLCICIASKSTNKRTVQVSPVYTATPNTFVPPQTYNNQVYYTVSPGQQANQYGQNTNLYGQNTNPYGNQPQVYYTVAPTGTNQ
eukprot:TRINITY_DN1076_c0_g1_i1.p1 TRINITY_DN1076_c0_g1~~TRINITY_DN1076_c0_g1_i1.p1  ORF type:complete len:232 (+),score=32.90 TRINITY_DN1076_c0_g1_i1:58-696(+)